MDSPKHVRGDLTGPPRLSGGSLGSRTPSSQQELQAVFVPLPMEAERDMEGHGGTSGYPTELNLQHSKDYHIFLAWEAKTHFEPLEASPCFFFQAGFTWWNANWSSWADMVPGGPRATNNCTYFQLYMSNTYVRRVGVQIEYGTVQKTSLKWRYVWISQKQYHLKNRSDLLKDEYIYILYTYQIISNQFKSYKDELTDSPGLRIEILQQLPGDGDQRGILWVVGIWDLTWRVWVNWLDDLWT
jgi:hypothetical protein